MIPEKKKTANNDKALVVHRQAGDNPPMVLSPTLIVAVEETNVEQQGKWNDRIYVISEVICVEVEVRMQSNEAQTMIVPVCLSQNKEQRTKKLLFLDNDSNNELGQILIVITITLSTA